MPKNISTTPITRPPSDTGAMSPKPTVVRVTMAHQTASGNGRSSSNQVSPAAPARISTTITPASRNRFSRRRKARSVASGRATGVVRMPIGRRGRQSVRPISIDAAR